MKEEAFTDYLLRYRYFIKFKDINIYLYKLTELYTRFFTVSDLFLFYKWENWNLKIPNNLLNFAQLGSTKVASNLGLLDSKVPLSSSVLCYLSRFLKEKYRDPTTLLKLESLLLSSLSRMWCEGPFSIVKFITEANLTDCHS